MFPFDPLENIRKPLVNQKGTLGRKGLTQLRNSRETPELICTANELLGFNMKETSTLTELTDFYKELVSLKVS